MSRGGSYGGGQSSLGYLFSADEQPSAPTVTPPIQPPYGIDITPEKPPAAAPHDLSPSEKQTEKSINNNYHRAQGQNTGNFITDRPRQSKSVPGGDSSFGIPVWRQVMIMLSFSQKVSALIHPTKGVED
ncbi:hypothetical protein CCACVL1_01932 [Corchorus capsularis]|uniref:Uncharacterized protein n=1 Tax=Corchorus capsularis TaxID=210143 RepID=A0A1R3KEA2_COCAP|nr:hypothetical protein CCACVL1_01932 [Corchorus capsularis]